MNISVSANRGAGLMQQRRRMRNGVSDIGRCVGERIHIAYPVTQHDLGSVAELPGNCNDRYSACRSARCDAVYRLAAGALRVYPALACDDEVGVCQRSVESRSVKHRVDAGYDACAENGDERGGGCRRRHRRPARG